jgi:signal transduction histidine kinase
VNKSSCVPSLRRIADQVLEAADVEGLAHLLTRVLPGAVGVPQVTLLVWDRKLEAFQALSPGETHIHSVEPGSNTVAAPETRFLLADGAILETPGGRGEGLLVPLMARSGLAGMLVLGPRRRRRRVPFRPAEARMLSVIATRSALALENHVYQKELIASERMAALGTMAGMLAHDLRGPMTVIKGYAETLIEGEVTPDDLRTRATLIVQMVDRLERMTRETLDFARGGGRLARRPISLPLLMDDLLEAVAEEMPTLDVVRPSKPPEVTAWVDVDKLRRVIGNLAANAKDAMGGAGRLHVDVAVEAAGSQGRVPSLVLVLADEGPGVPAEIRERLFEPFVTRGKKGGTGLGLAVARRFVEDHGGTLELLSDDGAGARFRLAVPLAASAGETPGPAVGTPV